MEKKQKINLQEYLYILLRRKWFFLFPLIVIYFSFLISSYFLPKIYRAQAVILIEEKKVMNPLLKNLAVSTTPKEKLNALKEEILAWPRLFQLVERLGLTKNIKSPLELEKLIFRIRKNINLRMKSNEVVVISYEGENPKSTQKLVNTLCDILIERNISSQIEDTESAIDFIKEQLAIYKNKLDKSEAALRKFKEVYGSGVFSKEENTLAQINKKIAELEAELVIASVDCTEEHPRIKELKRRINSLKKKRNYYIQELAKKAGVDPKTYVAIADSLPRQQEELIRLTRDKTINEKIYAMLLERLESAKITERLDNSGDRTKFRVIEPARLPLIPVKPDKLKLNFLGLLLGGMVGLGCVYLLEYSDTSFRSSQELKEYFGYPVLGSISKMLTLQELKRQRGKVRIIILFIILGILLASSIVFIIAHVRI